MTPEQQRIAIAQSCGWKGISQSHLIGYAPWRPKTYSDRVNTCPVDELECIPLDPLPNYLNDLNAMNEAEKALTDAQFEDYFDELESQVPFARPQHKRRHVCAATATQRAEAFLKTLGLWESE
jgi:hypothetical protein